MAQTRHFASPAYLAALGLIAIPPIDALMQVLPFRLQDPRWRFGFFGLLSNAMILPVVGLLIVFVAAEFAEHRRFQRVLGIASAVVAVTVFVLLALFALDALQLRRDVKPAAQLAFRVASLTAAAKSILGAVTLGAFGIAAFRGPKLPKAVTAKRASSLIVGGGKTPAPAGASAESLGGAE